MATQNIYDLVDTWNAGATTFTAIKMNVTDTASAAGSLLMDLQKGGVSQFSVDKSGNANVAAALVVTGNFQMPSNTSGFYLGSAYDLTFFRDAADTLAQRRTTNAQTFRVYNTYTDASNYERGFVRYSANVLEIGHEALGTGNSGRPVALLAGGVNYLSVGGGTGVWSVNTSGHLLCSTDNTRDIGASGANRPRDVYVANSVNTGGAVNASSNVKCGAANFFEVSGRSAISSASDGVLRISNNAATDFSRLQFGGTTSAFPALKRNSTAINVRLADDTADAPLTAAAITASGVLTVATTGVPQIVNSTNSNLFKFQFQDAGVTRGHLGADATYSFYVGSSAGAAQTRVVNATGVVENLAGITANAATAIPAGGTAGAGLMVSSTANFGVFFGSGAPTLSAAKGSLYLRSDGTTTNDRMYVNTNGSTTWTAVTTVA